MRPSFHGSVLALILMPACIVAGAAEDWQADESSGAAATRVGGVAELRGIALQAPGGSTETVHQEVLRLTLEHAFEQGPKLTAHAQWQHLGASDAQTLEQLQRAAPAADRLMRLTHRRERPRSAHTLEFDWLYLQGKWRHGSYTVGRQPINPSIGRLWSPVDVFAPFSPNDLERLYKPGVDAVQLAVYAAEKLVLTSIASSERRGSGAVRLNWQQRAELEASWGKSFLLVGERRAQRIAGIGGQLNDIAGGDLYGEMLWHRGPQALPGADGPRSGVRGLVGASRKLAANTVGTVELFHQSRGTDDPAQYDAFAQRAPNVDLPYMGVGRNYAGFSVAARPHPLIGLDLLLLANLGDRSAAATAAVEYTPLPDLKLRAALSLPVTGAAQSEYRRQGRTLQLGLQWFY